MPDITISGLSKSFGDTRVLDDVTFTVQDKEFVTLLGPSGCGKTTTLMTVAGFERPDKGRVACGQQVFSDATGKVFVPSEARNLGIVFQNYAIWPHLTVAQNVAFPLKIRRAGKATIGRQVTETLELVEMGPFAQRYPHELSGGQQQRVALARALVYSPSVLLLDEPFSNLDAKLRERARAWLKDLQRALGLTTLFVTHDQSEALSMSDRVLVMDHGTVLQAGTPEDIYHRPDARFVAEFLGQCNLLIGTVTSATASGTRVCLDGTAIELEVVSDRELTHGATTAVSIRPEAIQVVDSPVPATTNTYRVELRNALFLGSHYLYDVILGEQTLTVAHGKRLDANVVDIYIPPEQCRPLDV